MGITLPQPVKQEGHTISNLVTEKNWNREASSQCLEKPASMGGDYSFRISWQKHTHTQNNNIGKAKKEQLHCASMSKQANNLCQK